MRFNGLDHLDNIALARLVERGTAVVVEDAPTGLLLRDRASAVWFLSTEDVALGTRWLGEHARAGIELLMLVGDGLVGVAREQLGLTGHMDCLQAVYLRKDLPSCETDLRLRRAVPKDLPWVMRHYDLADEDELRDVIERQLLFVGERGGEDVGFVGEHQDGSMGLLHVLGPYRRRGIGADLERLMIARTLSRGEVPYCHVDVGNQASLALQRKLGLAFADRHVHWLW